eukprot:scaffold482_cov266-Amphora_coffeaeformis.AAC.62
MAEIIAWFRSLPDGSMTAAVVQRHPMLRPSLFLASEYDDMRPDDELLSKYHYDVIRNDYEGIIKRVMPKAPAAVIPFLAQWYQSETAVDVREDFEKILIAEHRESYEIGGGDWDTTKALVVAFPGICHDLVHADMNDSVFDVVCDDVLCAEYKNWLLQLYGEDIGTGADNNDEEESPSLLVVLYKSFFLSLQKSKYRDRLCEEQLKGLRWILMNKSNTTQGNSDANKKEEEFFLFDLLQNIELEPSQFLEKSVPCRKIDSFDNCRFHLGDSHFTPHHYWRQILKFLLSEKDGACKTNADGQLPLHVLLRRGLPGQDILVEANESALRTLCPVHMLYPFQIAAKAKVYDPAVRETFSQLRFPHEYDAAEAGRLRLLPEEMRGSFDREQLSQTYSLLRAVPDLVGPSKKTDAFCSAMKQCAMKRERLDIKKCDFENKKAQYERKVAELEKIRQEVDAECDEIATEEMHIRKMYRVAYEEEALWESK